MQELSLYTTYIRDKGNMESITVKSFFDEMEKCAKSVPLSGGRFLDPNRKNVIDSTLMALGLLGVGGGVIHGSISRRNANKELDNLKKKIIPLAHYPVGESYNPLKDVKKAEKLIGMPIKVIDTTRMDDKVSQEYFGSSAIDVYPEMMDNAAALWSKAKDEGKSRKGSFNLLGRGRKESDYGKQFKDPTIVISPSTSRAAVLHELGHLVDAYERVKSGKRSTRRVSEKFGEWDNKKDGNPLLMDEAVAWDKVREIDPDINVSALKKNALKTYKVGEEYSKKKKISNLVALAGLLTLLASTPLVKK